MVQNTLSYWLVTCYKKSSQATKVSFISTCEFSQVDFSFPGRVQKCFTLDTDLSLTITNADYKAF